ncbi:MAG: hypothetical protein Q7S86_02120 [bacterium]|nr:hypothetical protein [bacterium]
MEDVLLGAPVREIKVLIKFMSHSEVIQTSQELNADFSLEKIRKEIFQRIDVARNNPIARTRLVEIEKQLGRFIDTFLKNGQRDDAQIISENEIDREILQSCAVADNIVEFKEMLRQLAERYESAIGKNNEEAIKWAEDMLAHENAHANVAQATGHEWVGYAALFIKDEDGNLSSFQPLHFTKPKLEWGPRELITKSIEVIEAPEKYGNKLSEGDVESLAQDKQRLESIRVREEMDQRRISEIRKDLGIKA